MFGLAAVLILLLAAAGLATSRQYAGYLELTLHTYQVREHIDETNALTRAEAIRAVAARIELRHRGQRLAAPSVSIGLAMYPRDGHAPEELKRAADQAAIPCQTRAA